MKTRRSLEFVTYFNTKIFHDCLSLNFKISKVVSSIGIDIGDRLTHGSRKIKFVVNGPLPADSQFPARYRDFDVSHHYLRTSSRLIQSRLRKRASKGKATKVKSTYINTMRKLVSTILTTFVLSWGLKE